MAQGRRPQQPPPADGYAEPTAKWMIDGRTVLGARHSDVRSRRRPRKRLFHGDHHAPPVTRTERSECRQCPPEHVLGRVVPEVGSAGALLVNEAREPARAWTRDDQVGAWPGPSSNRRQKRVRILEMLDDVKHRHRIEPPLGAELSGQFVEPPVDGPDASTRSLPHGRFAEVHPDRAMASRERLLEKPSGATADLQHVARRVANVVERASELPPDRIALVAGIRRCGPHAGRPRHFKAAAHAAMKLDRPRERVGEVTGS